MASSRVSKSTTRRQKRIYVACQRCHSHKIRCSGEQPCHACSVSDNAENCEFPTRDRKITVSESYLKKLEAEVQKLSRPTELLDAEPPQINRTVATNQNRQPLFTDTDVSNPLFETSDELLAGTSSAHTVYVGEASCLAFGDRLLQCVNMDSNPTAWPPPTFFQHSTFNRLSNPAYQFPERIHAKLLVQVAVRFIGTDYHLILKKSFFEKMESMYSIDQREDLVWTCKFYALLALGELYSNRKTITSNQTIPGTDHFLQATSLLQDIYETPTVEQVEVFIIFSFYLNTLGRVKSAYTYCGIAMRLAISLGLHRSLPTDTMLSAVEREHRRRVWWTLYTLDRLSSSKLGYPGMISDAAIDAPLPCMDNLSPAEKEEFNNPSHLIANVKLAKITGTILNQIYCLPQKSQGTFVQRVHGILHSLRRWDEVLPNEVRFQPDGVPRNVASLHLNYNQCVILTTRPILLYLFKTRFHLGATTPQASTRTFSPTTIALADSCVQAAKVSNSILSKLFIDGALATFGYFDAQYLFSSTLILIMSAVMDPNVAISDAVQTGFNLLRSMRDDGNLPSRDYYERLQRIRSSVSKMREEEQRQNSVTTSTPPTAHLQSRSRNVEHTTSNNSSEQRAAPPARDRQQQQQSGADSTWALEGLGGMDALDNPFIDNFLAEKGFAWPIGTLPEDEALRTLAHELGDEFMFDTL